MKDLYVLQWWPDKDNVSCYNREIVSGLFDLLIRTRELTKDQKGFCVYAVGDCLADFS